MKLEVLDYDVLVEALTSYIVLCCAMFSSELPRFTSNRKVEGRLCVTNRRPVESKKALKHAAQVTLRFKKI